MTPRWMNRVASAATFASLPRTRANDVDLRESKTRLSRLIARGARGERIVIARDGVPVAVLCSPPRSSRRPDADPLVDAYAYAYDGPLGELSSLAIDHDLSMGGEPTFADSSSILAFAARRDRARAAARKALETLKRARRSIVATDCVLDDTLTLTTLRNHYSAQLAATIEALAAR
jgi:antitoxin (DNA-binding transcriptional repressor) of toxin-antitoxin stability system